MNNSNGNAGFENRADAHMKILQEIHSMYRKKNSDYGGSFTSLYKKFGLISPIIKLEDKLSRLESLLTKKRQVVEESIEDTLLDLANYAIMTVLELRDEKGLYASDRYNKFDYSLLPKVVAVDFDGTLVTGKDFPEIGDLNEELVDELNNGKYKDYKKILYTTRTGDSLTAALDYLDSLPLDMKIHFDAINENIPEVQEALFGGPAHKVWFDVLIDDKAISPEIACMNNYNDNVYLERDGVKA